VFVVFGENGVASPSLAPAPASVSLAVDGPWTLCFPQGRGIAPEPIALQRLVSWTDSDDIAVKHFSGTATYETTFSIPENQAFGNGRLWLDLGDLRETARVILNGRDLGIVWTPPYRVEIHDTLKPGENRLQVEVANLWANRIIGDLKHPASGTYTRTNMKGAFKPDQALIPAGLFGPVRIVSE